MRETDVQMHAVWVGWVRVVLQEQIALIAWKQVNVELSL